MDSETALEHPTSTRDVMAFIPTGGRVTAAVFAGPTWFSVSQEIATTVSFTESYPYDSAAFGTAATTKVKKCLAIGRLASDIVVQEYTEGL